MLIFCFRARSTTLERPQKKHQAVAGVWRAYQAGVTLGLVRARAEFLDVCFASLQALGEVFLLEHNQNIGLDDPDLFVC
jgi:hypothetical protein